MTATPARARSPRLTALALALAIGPLGAQSGDPTGDPTGDAGNDRAGTASAPAERFEVTEHLDLGYGDPERPRIRRQTLDLFVPENTPGDRPPPLLVFFHGGGWRAGSPRLYRPLGRALAEQGIAVAMPGYRLSPAVQHPTHAEDCARSVAWLLAQGERFGYDATSVALGGHSAGGHLAALLATAPEFLAAHDLTRERLLGVVALSAPLDVRAPVGVFLEAFGEDIDDRDDASPLRRELEDAPPFLIFWASDDMLGLDMAGRSMAKALEDAGVECQARCIDERDHISIAQEAAEPGDPVAEAILAFVQRHRSRPR